jgi:hypothetical protein
MWAAATGQPVGQPLTGHTDAVSSVEFSPGGHRVDSTEPSLVHRVLSAPIRSGACWVMMRNMGFTRELAVELSVSVHQETEGRGNGE